MRQGLRESFAPAVGAGNRRDRRSAKTTPGVLLPGLGITLGFTLTYLGLMVLIPVTALVLRAASLSWEDFAATVSDRRVLAACGLSLGAALVATAINIVFGSIAAWVLVRYSFPGRRLVDAMVDLPFALPTAVSGIALTAVYAPGGWIGRFLEPLGVQAVFSRLGVVIALTFIGLPFVIRTLQAAISDLDPEVEEAGASLGAGRLQVLRRVMFPAVLPAFFTAFALAFARAVGEYGSVIFISGNMPMKTEIAPLLIVTRLEQYDYAGATAIALLMLLLSLAMLLVINALQVWSASRR